MTPVQPPTCIRTYVRTVDDARTIFHAVACGILPMVTRRLDTEERRAIASGSVYVWEERVSHSDPSSSEIERWTDSIRWGASKVKDEFLYYREKEQDVEIRNSGSSFSIIKMAASQRREPLTKQTYSVNVFREPQEPRKWHLIAYFSESTIDSLYCIGSHPLYPGLAYLEVPPWQYQGARVVRHPRRHSDPSRRPLLPPSPPVPSPGTQTLPSSKRTSWTIDSDSEPRDERKLAPLALSNCAGIQARHPLDEKAVMSFSICDSFHVRERPKYQLQASAM